jgi:hypothetical protein
MDNQHNSPISHESFTITIADIVIEVQSPISAAELGIAEKFATFFGVPDNPLARVSLQWKESNSAPEPRGELIYDPGSIWKMYRDDEQFYAAMSYPFDDSKGQTQGVLRADANWDNLMLTEQRTGPQWQSLLTIGAGELLFRTKILLTDGVVFHASGLDDHGHGLVFVGHSGAGKSTQLDFWAADPGVVAMNDDRIAVRSNTNGATCYGLPWGGTSDIARNHAAPLSALVLLEQAPQNEIKQIPPAVAAPLLVPRMFLPYWDKNLMQRALANLDTLLTRVPVYHLRCRPEPAVIELVRSVL